MDRNFSAIRAYGTAKLENILFTNELHRRYHDRGISTVAFHPGAVATNFAAGSAGPLMRATTKFPLTRLWERSEQLLARESQTLG